MSELKHTPLYQQHLNLDAKIVDFGGWALPVNYGSQIEEHHAVRQRCGLFDVSHMTVWDIRGEQTLAFLQRLLANDIRKASNASGKAIYSCMLNDDGGVIDDLIAYYIDAEFCRLVTNAGTRDNVNQWLQQQSANYDINVEERPELALIALQGPQSIELAKQQLDDKWISLISALKRFQGGFVNIGTPEEQEEQFVGRTGYTGEDGLEFIVNTETAEDIWSAFIAAGAQPCGLGARDTLRLEAGMSLYGNELDTSHTPLESGLAWTVSHNDERDFIGKHALNTPPRHTLHGVILQGRGVLRGHQTVFLNDTRIGELTSGTYSPTLEQSIAIARLDADHKLAIGAQIDIEIRNKRQPAVIATLPFIKNGSPTNSL